LLYWIAFSTALIGVNVVSFLLVLWCLTSWVAPARRRRVLAWMLVAFVLLNLPLAVFFFRPLDALLMPFPVSLLENAFLPSAIWVTTLVMYSALGVLIVLAWVGYRLIRFRSSSRPPRQGGLVARARNLLAAPDPILDSPQRRQFIAGGMGLTLPALFGVATYGLHGALDELQVSPEVSVPIPHLPAALDGLRVVHLSDIHVGPYLRRRELESLVERVNTLRPDIIAITGDLIDRDIASLPDAVAGLRGLRAAEGIFLVTGNHDIYTDPFSFNARSRGAVRIADAMGEAGIRTLRDETVMIGEGAYQLAVMGMDWIVQRGSQNLFYDPARTHAALDEMDAKLSPGTPKLLLVHHPETFRECPAYEIGLTLAGHTHGGGQIVLGDFRGQPIGITQIRFTYNRGLYRQGNSSLYVSRGVGYLGLPIRLNCPPEIAQFRLTKPV
jgi:predicted MPP superfamily phosphohydrolase